MASTIDQMETKQLLKEVLVELLQERREEFYALFVEALEELGLANAIQEGRRNEFVSEEYVASILAEKV